MQIPSHVPKELVRDYNYFDMGAETDFLVHYKKLHNEPDIFYTPHNDGHWVLTRYVDMEAVLLNPTDFSSQHQTLPKKPFVVPLLEYDEKKHASFRRLLIPFFTNKALQYLEDVARDLSNELIDEIYQQGECEFVSEFAQRMPIFIVMRLLDLPKKDIPFLLDLVQAIIHTGDHEVQAQSFQKIFDYIGSDVIPKRRENPGDDVFSALVHGEVEDGRPLTDDEIKGLGSLLIAGGLDTVVAMLSLFTQFLAQNASHRQQLVNDPELINDAVEELLRRHHLGNSSRVAARDLEIKGIKIKAGDCVLLPLAAAGLDERRYDNPEIVDFNRNDKKHLVFAKGPHMCIGAFLARTELRVFLQEWLKRIPDFEIQAGKTPLSKTGTSNAMEYLPICWSVKP